MISLTRYINLFEGGQAGHMAHPIDYTDFTGNELKELVDSLFGGKVETMKEKLDGMNIMAAVNWNGDTIFVRNKTELNSEDGGILYKDLDARWDGKEKQKEVFKTAGAVIDKVFQKLGKDFFNPSENIRKLINCECIIAGKTNIMPYATDRVAFHGYKVYEKFKNKKGVDEWVETDDVEGDVDKIYKAAEGIDAAKPRPNLVLKSAVEASKFAEQFGKDLEKLFEDEGLTMKDTIEDWKKVRFNKFKPEWMDKYVDEIFNRWFNKDKSFKASELKKAYPDHYDEVKDDKLGKKYIEKVMQPLDELFLKIGNELIDMLDGFTNSGKHDETIDTLKKDMGEVIELVHQYGTTEVQNDIQRNLDRLAALGNKFNSAEGIVFTYKGRLCKLTGSFAPINQIFGGRFKVATAAI